MANIGLSDSIGGGPSLTARAMSAEHYDDLFTNLQNYLVSAEHSTYKVVWDKVLEKLSHECGILDVGCGPGQFASLCVKAGHSYVGADFSEVAINRGRKIVPGATFHLVDFTKDKSLLTKGNYDVVVLIEFLEHVEEDLEILSSVPEGKKFVLTVPKYWCLEHVRVFRTADDIYKRYGKLIAVESLDTIALGKTTGRRFEPDGPKMQDQWVIYVLSGTRQDNDVPHEGESKDTH